MNVLGVFQNRAAQQKRDAQRDAQEQATLAQQVAYARTTQAEVEQGRQALLQGDSTEAWLHLTEAYRRGERSPDMMFMLARALQARLAEQARFTSSSGRMWSAAFSPDGKRIVTTDDKSAQVRDAQTSRLLFTLPHGDTVYHAVYSADGTRVVTASGDGTVKIWDAVNGSLLRELTHDGKPTRYYLVAISPDGKLAAAIDTMGVIAHVWDAGTGARVAELRNDASGHPSVAFSPDGRLATSGGDDVRVFDTTTWARLLTIAGPRIQTLSFDSTGSRLATGTAGGDATIWEIPSGARIRHLREIGEPVEAVAFAPNDELIVAAGGDGTAEVWDAKSGALRNRGRYVRGKILSVEFDPTSKLVLAAGDRGAVALVDAELGLPVSLLEGPRGVTVAHFDPTSRRVIGASWDGTARVWDATSLYRRWSSPPVGGGECGLLGGVEPDHRFLAIGCRDRATRVWDTARDQLLAELPSVSPISGGFEPVLPAVSTAGDRAAVARGNTVEVYDLAGGKLIRTIAHGSAVSAVAFAGAGRDLVSGAVDGSLLVTRDGGDPISLPVAGGGIDSAGFLPDGRVVAADTRPGLRVYDIDRAAVLAELEVQSRVRSLRVSPEGHRLLAIPSYASPSKAAPPVIWDLAHYQLIARLEGHVGRVLSARFVAGGHEIVTAGNDGTARLWDGSTGRLIQTYHADSRFLADATVSPDRLVVAAGDADGLLHFWDLTSGRPLWALKTHGSPVVGVHFDGDDLVTRGLGGDVSRWTLPTWGAVIEACGHSRENCGIVSK
jgi:WD40 repeat protein